jgi:chromosome segregation ATPase
VLVEEADLAVRPPGRPDGHSRPLDWVDGRVVQLEAERDALREALGQARERAARAEGKAETLERALADLADRLDQATEELRELRRPWWRRLLG